MELKDLQARLHDPDQWVRVETLRILAMVEETRALREIEWVFKNDPEPGVRQVAQWAGRIVYAAQKQTKRATETQQMLSAPTRVEDALLDSLVEKDARTYGTMQAENLQRELEYTMNQPQDNKRLPPGAQVAALPAPETREIVTRANHHLAPNLDELLDAGLSEDFFVP